MFYVLVITTADGHVTRNEPVQRGARVALAVAEILSTVTLSRREADRLALLASRVMGDGTTWVHDPSGYRFRIETTETPTAPFTDESAHLTLTVTT